MKISIIGAGNVGALTAMRISQENLGEVLLIDIVKGMACGKAFDLDDSRYTLKNDYCIKGTEDFAAIKDSNIIVITAGLPRKPGMTREDLLNKNAQIVKDVCLQIKDLAKNAIIIIVTNPLDLMTYVALKTSGFKSSKVFGMGPSLDASRFANLISREFKISFKDIRATVIGSHGETMLPLPNFTYIKGVPLSEYAEESKVTDLVGRTRQRGLEIVSLLGTGSAFFAPSAAITEIVKIIALNQKTTIGLSTYLNGEYSVKDICIGVPVILGKNGIEQVIELKLEDKDKEDFIRSAESIRTLSLNLNLDK